LYGQVKEKILGNSGILVLKWYKIIQDRLYNQVVLAMNAGQGHTITIITIAIVVITTIPITITLTTITTAPVL
jgi:hypothetical protein